MISRNAGKKAMEASTMLNRVSTLVNIGYVEELDNDLRTDEVRGKPSSFTDSRSGYANSERGVKPNPRSGYTNSETWVKPNLRSSFTDLRNIIQEEYINEEDGILNRKEESI